MTRAQPTNQSTNPHRPDAIVFGGQLEGCVGINRTNGWGLLEKAPIEAVVILGLPVDVVLAQVVGSTRVCTVACSCGRRGCHVHQGCFWRGGLVVGCGGGEQVNTVAAVRGPDLGHLVRRAVVSTNTRHHSSSAAWQGPTTQYTQRREKFVRVTVTNICPSLLSSGCLCPNAAQGFQRGRLEHHHTVSAAALGMPYNTGTAVGSVDARVHTSLEITSGSAHSHALNCSIRSATPQTPQPNSPGGACFSHAAWPVGTSLAL